MAAIVEPTVVALAAVELAAAAFIALAAAVLSTPAALVVAIVVGPAAAALAAAIVAETAAAVFAAAVAMELAAAAFAFAAALCVSLTHSHSLTLTHSLTQSGSAAPVQPEVPSTRSTGVPGGYSYPDNSIVASEVSLSQRTGGSLSMIKSRRNSNIQ